MSSVANDELQDTRRLLEELDALMQQMLAMPPGSSPAPPQPETPPVPTVTATLTLVPPSAPSADGSPLTTVAVPPRIEPAPLPPPVPPRTPRRTALYEFLRRIDQGFDRVTRWLGPIGALLRSRLGRLMLGFTGWCLLAVALARLWREWLGWHP